jgi:hypothetical protein
MFESLYGMTERQMELAFKALVRAFDKEAVRRWCKASDRITLALRVIEVAIHRERQELLTAMYRRYPAAARRILAGLQGRQPSKGKKAGRAKAG